MEPTQFSVAAQQWANDILVWIGFGTVVGLLAKAIMPGRDPGGAIATLGMGIGGVIIGCGTVSFFFTDHRVIPISPMGAAVGTGGAFAILLFYRLLSGYLFVEGETRLRSPRRVRGRRRARYDSVHSEEV